MNVPETIVGLGAQSGLYLLDFLKLDSEDDQIAGPEFTYLGTFMSGLCYQEKIDSTNDLVPLCLSSLSAIRSQLKDLDAMVANTLAESAIRSYNRAVQAWPNKEARGKVGIALCQILTERLKKFASLELTTLQIAKLRPKIEEQFEVLEIAYTEMCSQNLFGSHQAMSTASSGGNAVPYTLPNGLFDDHRSDEIADAKKKLVNEFEEGDITAREFQNGLDNLIKKERSIYIAAAESRSQRNAMLALAAAFLIGFLIGPWLYPKIFGYSSAEECVLNTKHQYAVGACYDLYPSVQK